MTRSTTLPSGLRVVSQTMPGLETAAVALYADSGSRHEPAWVNGLAHLFEHMVFKGAGERSAREISEAIEDVGGDLNAATDRDTTSFSASVMGEHAGLAVELIADMLLRPRFDADDLEREKEVVLQELAEACDTPSDIIFDELWAAAFPDQPLGRSILGSETSIAAITVADLHAWRADHYRGGNLILAAAGQVEHDALVALAEEHLADLPPGPAMVKAEPARFGGGRRIGTAKADQAQITLAFEAPAELANDYFAARLFADAVGGGASSRLFQELREDRGLAYSVSATVHPYADTGMFYVHAATARRDAAAAIGMIERLLAAAPGEISQRELDRVRMRARAGLLMALETPWGQASYAARQLAVYGRLVEPAEVVEQLNAVTLEQLREAGARMVAGPSARATIGVPAARAA